MGVSRDAENDEGQIMRTKMDSQMWDAVNALFGKDNVFKARKEAEDHKCRQVLRIDADFPQGTFICRLEFDFNTKSPNPFKDKPA